MNEPEIINTILSVVAIVISIWSATTVTRNKSQRDFLMEECRMIKSEYLDFVRGLKNGEIGVQYLRDELKNYSARITTLLDVIEKEYKVKQNHLKASHADFQDSVTDMDSVNDQYQRDRIQFSPVECQYITTLHMNLDKELLWMVVNINRSRRKVFSWN